MEIPEKFDCHLNCALHECEKPMMAPESERANYMQRLPGGMCFAHGRYAGMECPKWPACATDRQNPDFVREGMREVNKIGVDGEEVEVGRGGQQTKSSTSSESPSACSEVVERLAKSRAEQFYDAWALRYAERPIGERFVVPHSYEAMFRLMDEYAHSWRERRVQELERELLYAHGLLWKLRNTAKSALTDAKFETDELLAKRGE